MADACRERDPSEGAANTPTGAAPGVLDGVTGLTAQDGQRPIQAELWEPRTSSVRLEVVPQIMGIEEWTPPEDNLRLHRKREDDMTRGALAYNFGYLCGAEVVRA